MFFRQEDEVFPAKELLLVVKYALDVLGIDCGIHTANFKVGPPVIERLVLGFEPLAEYFQIRSTDREAEVSCFLASCGQGSTTSASRAMTFSGLFTRGLRTWIL
jgi:hypothetical protein